MRKSVMSETTLVLDDKERAMLFDLANQLNEKSLRILGEDLFDHSAEELGVFLAQLFNLLYEE